MTPEAKVKKAITAYLTSIGAWWDMPVRTGYGKRGVPDIVGCHKGMFFALEVKATADGEATPWQKREIAAIEKAGGSADVVSSVEAVQHIMFALEMMAP
jgi:Holliday junction resolvase